MIGRWRAYGLLLILLMSSLSGSGLALADPTPYDLAGPVLRVSVTRGRAASLPIAQVPNLEVGDQIQIRADLPALPVGALSAGGRLPCAGATNPPPEKWFFSAQTWTARGREGLKLAVPAGAQQVLVFLAPESGGDLKAVMDAVRGRPGRLRSRLPGPEPGLPGPLAPRRLSGRDPPQQPDRSGPSAGGLAAGGAQPGDQARHRLPEEDAGTAGGLSDAGPGLAGAERQRKHLDRPVPDHRRSGRPDQPAQRHPPGRLWSL